MKPKSVIVIGIPAYCRKLAAMKRRHRDGGPCLCLYRLQHAAMAGEALTMSVDCRFACRPTERSPALLGILSLNILP